MGWSNCEQFTDTACFYFDKTSDPATWPNNVSANALSSTGYAYGNIAIVGDNRSGFELPDKVWIIKDRVTKVAYWINDDEFQKNFKLVD
jgi:hypothetical protein